MDFAAAFEALSGNTPFAWQSRLYDEYFSKGEIPAALDLPTGLGKTSVMTIWLVARALSDTSESKKLPRRLFYVVDRRAVVDQATAEAEKLRNALEGRAEHFSTLDETAHSQILQTAAAVKQRLSLTGEASLPISTLRGQHVDNREWLADPAAPAIVVGTVDMIGSRLLFEGYGVSRKMRPYHAGLLGADALIVLDEAHLVPPFEKLLETIEEKQQTDGLVPESFGPRHSEMRAFIPPFRLLSLSATGRERKGASFKLENSDYKDGVVKQRLSAKKALSIVAKSEKEKLENALADQAWALSEDGTANIRCLVFCDSRDVAEKTKAVIDAKAKGKKKTDAPLAHTALFTGARRFFERERASAQLGELGFIAGSAEAPTKPAFLIATSAAEVGVDLDADHLVCDLAPWERMVQRLGRVNRRGNGDAKVIVIDEGKPKPKKTSAPTPKEQRDQLAYMSSAIIRRLPEEGGGFDGSPGALRELKIKAETDPHLQKLIDDATTPAPLRPALTRALIDAWSMTSLDVHAGRPDIEPWLRGWIKDNLAQTAVVWRHHLPVRQPDKASDKSVNEFFEAAPPHISEQLETETYRVVDWLIARAASLSVKTEEKDNVVAFALSHAREVNRTYTLEDLGGDAKTLKQTLERDLAGAVLVVDSRIAGLSEDGLLANGDCAAEVRTPEEGFGDKWLWEKVPSNGEPGVPLVKFRIREKASDDPEASDDSEPIEADNDWREIYSFAIELDGGGNPTRSLVVDKWRGAIAKEEARSISMPQTLAEHQSWTEQKARTIAASVGLTNEYENSLAIAARLHDEGKRARRWQRAFKAERDAAEFDLTAPLAKTRGPIEFGVLGRYRHEFGSLPRAETDECFKSLPLDLQDLVLHLIAAHHGQARPVIETQDCEDGPPSALADRARDVALRFARLQKQWGPWGLAWWEALLRAADQQASRENDERGKEHP